MIIFIVGGLGIGLGYQKRDALQLYLGKMGAPATEKEADAESVQTLKKDKKKRRKKRRKSKTKRSKYGKALAGYDRDREFSNEDRSGSPKSSWSSFLPFGDDDTQKPVPKAFDDGDEEEFGSGDFNFRRPVRTQEVAPPQQEVKTKPKKKLPSGRYKPTSRYAERGARKNISVITMGGKNGASQKRSEYDIQKTIRKKQSELMSCYKRDIEIYEDLSGKVWMTFGIAADGHVALVDVTRSTLRSKNTEHCFVKKARRWRFKKVPGSALTKFNTHFVFEY